VAKIVLNPQRVKNTPYPLLKPFMPGAASAMPAKPKGTSKLTLPIP
jgi:hypothetical protein